MKYFILILTSVLFFNIHAQKEESPQKTLFGSKKRSLRAYIAINHKTIELNNQLGFMAGGEVSLVFNHKFNLGFFGYGMYNDVQSNYIDSHNYRHYYEVGMGGLKLEPVFFSNSVVHFTTPLEIGVGGISLNRNRIYYEDSNFDWESSINDYNFFGFIEPGIKAEINLFKNLRFSGGIGYQFTDVVNLAGTNNYPLNGFVGNVSLKLGWF